MHGRRILKVLNDANWVRLTELDCGVRDIDSRDSSSNGGGQSPRARHYTLIKI